MFSEDISYIIGIDHLTIPPSKKIIFTSDKNQISSLFDMNNP